MLIGMGLGNQPASTTPLTDKLVEEVDLMPKSAQSCELTPRHIEKQIDGNVGNHSTSNNMYNAVVGPGGISTRGEMLPLSLTLVDTSFLSYFSIDITESVNQCMEKIYG